MRDRAEQQSSNNTTVSDENQQLEEMRRLGFWDKVSLPAFPEELIRKEEALFREVNDLLAKNGKEKEEKGRVLLRQRNRQKKLEKVARWKMAQQETISYLGEDISAGLNQADNNLPLLQKYDLPVFNTFRELADHLQCDLATLKYLSYNRRVTHDTHYYTFRIPKKSGGVRQISAPKRKLKKLQQQITETILNRMPVCDHIHGFTKGRSILTNASPHLGKDIIINLDLKDFFPSISYKRVKGLFRKFGYSEQFSVLFALICTQAATQKIEFNGENLHVQTNRRFLPQGSPASPAISNRIAYMLDKRLEGVARKYNFTYTRYADDLTFSAFKEQEQQITRLLYFVKKVIQDEGFILHPEKTQIMRKHRQQKVTGIVVNQRPNVDRQQLRKFRALLHNIEINGWQEQQWGSASSGYLPRTIEGYINFIRMVNPGKAKRFEEQLMKIVFKHGYPPESVSPEPEKKTTSGKAKQHVLPETSKPEEDWWGIES